MSACDVLFCQKMTFGSIWRSIWGTMNLGINLVHLGSSWDPFETQLRSYGVYGGRRPTKSVSGGEAPRKGALGALLGTLCHESVDRWDPIGALGTLLGSFWEPNIAAQAYRTCGQEMHPPLADSACSWDLTLALKRFLHSMR